VLGQTPPGWTRLDTDAEGLPLWRRGEDPVCVATNDLDVLRCIGAALTRFEDMNPQEFEEFVTPRRLSPGPLVEPRDF
jgi:hypothetical protein